MDFYDARALYLADLRRLGRSENTIRSAEQALTRLGNSVRFGPFAPVGGVNLEDIEQMFSCWELAPASYNRYRSALISFFDYCVSHGYCNSNPAKQLPTRRVVDQPKLILTPEQMLGMLDGANPVERIALALGMNTALRASDIVSLRVGDVDLESLTLRTKIQKTGGYDEKPITNQLAEELRRWFASYKRAAVDMRPAEFDSFCLYRDLQSDWYLVPAYQYVVNSTVWHAYNKRQITHPHRLVQRALERLGLPTEGEGFHTLRRSSARALFEKLREEGGYDHGLMVVREFLNHRSVEQTQRYLGVSHERQIRDATLRGRDFLVRPAQGGASPLVKPAPSIKSMAESGTLGEAMEPQVGVPCDNRSGGLACTRAKGHPLPHSTQCFDAATAPVCWYVGDQESRPFVGTSLSTAAGDGLIPKPYFDEYLKATFFNSDGETVASQLIDINSRHGGYTNPERVY